MNKKTAWYNTETIPETMLKAVTGQLFGWKQLEDSDHYESLKSALHICSKSNSLLDLGCGAGEVSRVFNHFDYTGADLQHIIEKVAKKKNPDNKYLYFDANLDNLEFLQNYDLVLMNSFLSEIPDYFTILNKVLFNSKKYIVIHRQHFDTNNSRLVEYPSYGGVITTKTIINYQEFYTLCDRNNFLIKLNIPSSPSNDSLKTIVLERN